MEFEVWGDEEEKKEEERKNERVVGEKNRRERFWDFIQVGLSGSWVELLLVE